MSAETQHARPAGHGHDSDHHHDDGVHASRKGYWIGFLLSVVLTAIPFWLVMSRPLSDQTTALIIMGFAMVQIVVHIVFFLHVDRKAEEGWTIMSLLFTIVIVGIALAGSLWVMYHMNTNMMPAMPNMEGMG